MHVTLRENVLRHDALALRRRKQRTHLCLHIRRESRIRLSRDFERLRCTVRRHSDGVFRRRDVKTSLRQRIGDGADMLRHHAIDGDAFPANRTRDEERPGLDAIRNDVVLRAMQFLHAFDD